MVRNVRQVEQIRRLHIYMMGRIEERILSLEKVDTTYAAFAHRIQRLARQFENESLLSLLTQYLMETKE